MIIILQFFSFLFFTTVIGSESLYPFGDVRNCLSSKDVNVMRMEALPGVGYDNLRNIEMSAIVQYNYSLCKTTNDGRFLIPDDVITIPIQRSRLDSYATIIDHWDDYVSMTSASINLGATIYSAVSGKFGFEYQHVKEQQIKNEAKTTRIQMRTSLYKVILEPDAQLNPKFKSRLLDIAANIQNNNTAYASYLCELLVRDYGTHVLRSIDAGAVVSQIDSISSKYIAGKKGNTYNITAAAAASFESKFSFDVTSGVQHDNTHLNTYLNNRYYSQLVSIGGPIVHPKMTLTEWEAGVLNTLVPVDRSGDPLHFVVTSVSLPELPSPTLRQLVEYVYAGVEMYYSANTHHGCTDPSSPNFNFDANLNDGSCSLPRTNYTFGGVFQTCELQNGHDAEDICTNGYETLNPLTGNYTCPDGYTPLLLHKGVVTHVTKQKKCDKVCHHSGLFGLSRTCQCLTAWLDVLSAATYHAYWCAAHDHVPEGSGALFGGIYTSKNINPVTRSMTCPYHFYPLHIGQDIEVCISTQFQNAYKFSVPFGGLFSCKSGNPFANNEPNMLNEYPKHCPSTYKRFLATVDEGCEINYCSQIQSDFFIKSPKLPPFHSKPCLKVNMTQSMVMQGPYGELWVRDDRGNWMNANSDRMTGEEVLEHLAAMSSTLSPSTSNIISGNNQDRSGDISAVTIGLAACVSVLIVALVIVFIVIGVYFIKKKKLRVTSIVISPHSYSSIDGAAKSRNNSMINDDGTEEINI